MDSKPDMAVNFFCHDCNCAQSVLLAFSGNFGLSPDRAMQLASGFGGGIASSGGMCGAITGGIMALGLAGTGNGASKVMTYEQSAELINLFKAKFGSTDCKILTESKASIESESHCVKFVREAVLIVESLLEKKNKNG